MKCHDRHDPIASVLYQTLFWTLRLEKWYPKNISYSATISLFFFFQLLKKSKTFLQNYLQILVRFYQSLFQVLIKYKNIIPIKKKTYTKCERFLYHTTSKFTKLVSPFFFVFRTFECVRVVCMYYKKCTISSWP